MHDAAGQTDTHVVVSVSGWAFDCPSDSALSQIHVRGLLTI
jgi:hypothetical protein